MSHGLSFRQAAAQLGVHHVTLLNAMKRDEEFAQQVSEARLDAVSAPLLTVVKASRTSWRAAAWLAKFLNDRRVSCYETTPEEHQLTRLNKTNDTDKQARYRPANPDKKPLGEPTVRKINAAELETLRNNDQRVAA